MMTDVRWPAATPATRGTEGRRIRRRAGLQRAGKWCAAALVAGATVALSAVPATAAYPSRADSPPSLWGDPITTPLESMPFIPRESSGDVTFGLTGTEDTPTQVKQLTMRVYSPEHTRLENATLTALDGTPGGWTCKMSLGMKQTEGVGDRMVCTTDYTGPLPAKGQAWRWAVRILVPCRPMPDGWQNSTNGWAVARADSADGSGSAWSNSMTMGLHTTPPDSSTACSAPSAPLAPYPLPSEVEVPEPAAEPSGSGKTAGLPDLGGILGALLHPGSK
jgi:hypothetical protein